MALDPPRFVDFPLSGRVEKHPVGSTVSITTMLLSSNVSVNLILVLRFNLLRPLSALHQSANVVFRDYYQPSAGRPFGDQCDVRMHFRNELASQLVPPFERLSLHIVIHMLKMIGVDPLFETTS
jgi:hypothetical protein